MTVVIWPPAKGNALYCNTSSGGRRTSLFPFDSAHLIPHCSAHLSQIIRARCRSSILLICIMTSYAYRCEGNPLLGFHRCLCSALARVSIKILKRVGLAGPPCVTPLSILASVFVSFPKVVTVSVCRVWDIMAVIWSGSTFAHHSNSRSLRTVVLV